MKRYQYKLKPLNGDYTNAIESDELLDNPFKKEIAANVLGYHDDIPAKLDQEGNEIEPALPKNYEVVLVDRQEELAAEQAAKDAKESSKLVAKDAKKALQAIKNADNLNKLQKASEDLAKVVHALVKALDLVDPTEGE